MTAVCFVFLRRLDIAIAGNLSKDADTLQLKAFPHIIKNKASMMNYNIRVMRLIRRLARHF